MSYKKELIEIGVCECNRCLNKWHTRLEHEPKICPACRSPYWNRERVQNCAGELQAMAERETRIIPWPAGFVQGAGGTHPAWTAMTRLHRLGVGRWSMTFDGKGAHVYRRAAEPAPGAPGVSWPTITGEPEK